MGSYLWWVDAHYSPQLVERWTYVSSPFLYSHPPGQEQVPQDEAHGGCCDAIVRGLGRRLPVNFGCWIVVFVWCKCLIILYRTPLYINVVTFVYVPWVIICVRPDPSTLGDYLMPGFWCPWNPGLTFVAKGDGVLTLVGVLPLRVSIPLNKKWNTFGPISSNT
jgi:hypothetical protein